MKIALEVLDQVLLTLWHVAALAGGAGRGICGPVAFRALQ